MKKFFLMPILLICLFISIQCTNRKIFPITMDFLNGQYACLDSDSTYTEIYIENKSISFYSEHFGLMGPYELFLKDGDIIFNEKNYSMEQEDCNHMIWRDLENEFRIERIDTSKFISDSLKVNPFYIRRYYFLAKNGLITIEDFIDYFIRFKEPVPTDDYIIISNPPPAERNLQ